MTPIRSVELGQPGVFELLQFLGEGLIAPRDVAVSYLEKRGVGNAESILGTLNATGLVSEDRTGRLSLTQSGRKHRLLLSAINGTPLEEIVPLLSPESPSIPGYYLLTHDMTNHFIMNLHEKPDFACIYICSPWLAFDRSTLDYLVHALALASRRENPRILVITRAGQSPEGIDALKQLGAEVVFHDQLHTKLYIREPGASGGPLLAVIGSQNLTRSKYIELGIAIRNDSIINSKLIAYFYVLHSNLDA